jgi:hypothetical protein
MIGASAGEHRIAVKADGYKRAERSVKVEPARPAVVQVNLERLPAKKVDVEPPPKKKVEPPAPVEKSEPSIAVPLALIIGGVVVAGAGGGLHAWGLGAESELKALNGTWAAAELTVTEAQARIDSLYSDASTGTTAAFVMYGLGVGLITAGAVLWGLQGSDSDGEGLVDVVLSPVMVPHGGGMTLKGRF